MITIQQQNKLVQDYNSCINALKSKYGTDYLEQKRLIMAEVDPFGMKQPNEMYIAFINAVKDLCK